jgi:alpha-1,2-mannosyltransferase
VEEAPGVEVDRARLRPVWFDAFLVGTVAFAVFALTAHYQDPLNNDAHATAVAAWQLAHHGNATLTAFHGRLPWLYAVDDRYVTNRLPGTILWAAPFYALTGAGSSPPIFPSAIAAAVASALAVAFAFALCCRLVSRPAALVCAGVFAFATGTWTVSADQLWTHGPAQAAVLLTLVFVVRNQWLLAGLPAGFAILIRPHLGIVALVLCVAAVVRSKRAKPLLIGVGAAAGAAILLAYNNSLWGGISIFGGYHQPVVASDHKFTALITGFVGDFVSPERGLLVMTPALLLLLPGIRPAWRVAPPWVRWSTIAGCAYLVLQLWGIRFSGGDGFYSYRTTLETLSLCVPLFTLTWREWTSQTRARRAMFAALATTSVALHAFGAVINWVPGGVSDRPWQTYLPDDLARHVGAAQTSAWLAGTVVAAVAATVLTWRHQQPTGANPDATQIQVAAA